MGGQEVPAGQTRREEGVPQREAGRQEDLQRGQAPGEEGRQATSRTPTRRPPSGSRNTRPRSPGSSSARSSVSAAASLIGWTGVGAVACGALAGAAGSLVTGAMKGHTGMDLFKDALIGGTVGALTGGLFSIGGAALGSGVRSALSGAGARSPSAPAGGAARAEAGQHRPRHGRCGPTGAQRRKQRHQQRPQRLAASGGCTHSFDPRTRVLMAGGTTKPIKDVRIGDAVAASAPATGTTLARTVVATHRNLDTGPDRPQGARRRARSRTLNTTQHHPFWNADAKAWSDAKDLSPGYQAERGRARRSHRRLGQGRAGPQGDAGPDRRGGPHLLRARRRPSGARAQLPHR